MDFPELALRNTTQKFEPKESMGLGLEGFWYGNYFHRRTSLLPAWGLPYRDRELRNYYRHPHNWIGQGTLLGIIKEVASTPFEVKGDSDRKVKYFQDLLVNANFGQFKQGWRGFIHEFLLDYLTADFGGVVEIIGGGNSMSPLNGEVQAIAHLDTLRCTPTGNPEYPILYMDKDGELHRMHTTRVARMWDMPDGDTWARGAGLCALSRMVSIVEQQILMSKYNVQRLDDLPPSGLLMLNNIARGEWQTAKAGFDADRRKEGNDTWASVMVFEGLKPDAKAEAQLVTFSNLPEHFDYQKFVEIQVNAVALAVGVDPQDIWPLTGQPLGTGTQSRVLERKAKGKMLGDLLAMLERFINFHILPEEMEFQFKYQDDEADKTRADIAQVHTTVANELVTLLGSTPQARQIAVQYLADNVESFRDVLIDENGELIELTDDDPKTDEQTADDIADEIIADETTPLTDATGANPAIVAGQDTAIGLRSTTAATKDIQAVRLDFEDDFAAMIESAQGDDMARRRAGIVARALVTKNIRRAYEEGLKAGGVGDALSVDDYATINSMAIEQSSYITAFLDRIYKEDALYDAENRASMWFNKSIYPAYDAGLMSADKNGMYEWVYGDAEHCDDCQRLNGQRHRLKDWFKNDWHPKSSKLQCHGDRCKCERKRVSGKERGSY